jgi:hypothetical protein
MLNRRRRRRWQKKANINAKSVNRTLAIGNYFISTSRNLDMLMKSSCVKFVEMISFQIFFSHNTKEEFINEQASHINYHIYQI